MKEESGLTITFRLAHYIHSPREDQSKLRKGFKKIEEAVAKLNRKRGNMLEADNERSSKKHLMISAWHSSV